MVISNLFYAEETEQWISYEISSVLLAIKHELDTCVISNFHTITGELMVFGAHLHFKGSFGYLRLYLVSVPEKKCD